LQKFERILKFNLGEDRFYPIFDLAKITFRCISGQARKGEGNHPLFPSPGRERKFREAKEK
jgi:hypothetical protein